MADLSVNYRRPIKSELKSRKKVFRAPEDPVGSAVEKLLRENYRYKYTYAVNPYAEVYRFRDNIYGIYTDSIDGAGDPWMFLIEGPEKALLIDTSFGLGDLKGLLKEIIGNKPVLVANTHSDFDHAYGNYQFDTVYCHEYEEPIIRSKMNPHVWDYLFDENGNGIWADFDRKDLVPFREYNLIGVPDGYIFDLGCGYEVELIHTAGHSIGHAGFLDRQARIFFAGDDACIGGLQCSGGGLEKFEHREYATVEALCMQMKKVVGRMDEFDSVFPSHGLVDLNIYALINLISICESILENPNRYDCKHIKTRDGITRAQYGRLIPGAGYLNYSETSVYMNKVWHADSEV
ncbi:MAG: MBL fold metallo-hydrolase [Lachnospiraceae bacterium]|nr:MBL fold metallo-hydrolase [Lachnospiraceae bacterium]